MAVIANTCINKCDYIQQVYDKIINDKFGTQCLNKSCITLCDLIDVFPTVFTDTPTITIEGCPTINTIVCSITLTELTTTCSPISLIEL